MHVIPCVGTCHQQNNIKGAHWETSTQGTPQPPFSKQRYIARNWRTSTSCCLDKGIACALYFAWSTHGA